MKKTIAKLLRHLADRLDAPSRGFEKIYYKRQAIGIQDAVVENEGPNLWHPDQDGNVIEAEPPLITKARRDGNLPKM